MVPTVDGCVLYKTDIMDPNCGIIAISSKCKNEHYVVGQDPVKRTEQRRATQHNRRA